MSKPTAIETMNSLLGSNYQIVSNGHADPVVLAKLPDEDLMPKNASIVSNGDTESSTNNSNKNGKTYEKTTDDYLFQFYLGSLTVVGLFILFRMIQKN